VGDGSADLVLGRREARAASWPLRARVGNAAVAALVRRSTGVPIRDCPPMRAARREALLGLRIADRRFGWPLEMVLRAARSGWRIHEVPVPYRPRMGGRSKVTGTLAGTVRAASDMARVWSR
jgi:hypothetical protein